MVTVFFAWWYGAGWLSQAANIKQHLLKLLDLFSIPLLTRTLFAPFHQYSAAETGRGPTEALKAWANRSFSRLFGFMVRSLTILIGSLTLLIVLLIELIWLVLWLLFPWVPVLYVVAAVMRLI